MSSCVPSAMVNNAPRECPVTRTFVTLLAASPDFTPLRTASAVRSNVSWKPEWTSTPAVIRGVKFMAVGFGREQGGR